MRVGHHTCKILKNKYPTNILLHLTGFVCYYQILLYNLTFSTMYAQIK